uniref:Uncharacterized protein n=1 Tax=Oryza brachyantha TaxID=4533 RepID=J3MVX3_ORYBR
MENSDSSLVRISVPMVPAPAPAPAPTQQARRALSALQVNRGLGVAPLQQVQHASSGQHHTMPIFPMAGRRHVDGGDMMPISSLPVSQVLVGGMVVSTFMVTTVRRQQGPLYLNTTVLPRQSTVPVSALPPPPPTTQMLALQNTMPPPVASITGERITNNDATISRRQPPDILGLYGIISPVAVHANGNPLTCIYCGGVFSLSVSDIPGLLPPPGFNYPDPIGPPPLPLPLPIVEDVVLTTVKCSNPNHFVLTMQHMPRHAMADLIWSSKIPSVHIPSPICDHGSQNVQRASSLAGIIGAPTQMLNPMPIQTGQGSLTLNSTSMSTSLVGIVDVTVPSMFDLMPMAIHKEPHAPPLPMSSSSPFGLFYESVMPEHEDMVRLNLGQSCTMDLDLGL